MTAVPDSLLARMRATGDEALAEVGVLDATGTGLSGVATASLVFARQSDTSEDFTHRAQEYLSELDDELALVYLHASLTLRARVADDADAALAREALLDLMCEVGQFSWTGGA